MRYPTDRFCDLRHIVATLLFAMLFLGAAAAAPAADSRLAVRPAAVLPPPAAERAEEAREADRERHHPVPLTLYAPTAWPEALPEGQATDVKFTVLVTGGVTGPQPEVSLQIRGLDRDLPMRDDGRGPDLSAGDRIYSALVRFEAADARAGRCYDVHASTRSGKQTVTSAVRRLCASRIPIGASPSDFSAANVIVYSQGGDTARVIADEVLLRVSPNLGDDRIIALAAAVNGNVVGSLPAEQIYQIRLPAQTAAGLQQTLRKLERAGGVLAAVPNALGQLQVPPVVPVTTNDPLLATQWGLDRIKARHAWAITTGDPSTLIAVIDTGADFDHPDFWAGSNTRFATDGGGNLVAADCTGSSCVAVSQPTTCHATNVCNTGNAATDTYGHGTVVAGFAVAAANNALGIAGVNWQARLLAVRYAADNSSATALNLAQGINYARTQNARILSISTANPTNFFNLVVCPSVTGADGEGRLVVAAAGNDGATTNNYPAACAGAMPVANSEVNASDQDVIHTGTLASNYGTWIAIAAPGTAVLSTARTAAACPTCDPTLTSATGYATLTGTSLSTPLVAGAAALVLARSPSTTNADLRALLFSTGVPLQAPAAHIRRIDLLAALLTFNTAPTAINLTGVCIPENTDTTAGVSAGTLSTVDADAGTTGFEYTVVGGADQAKFGIGGVNADQLMLSDGVLDYETKPSYAVRVRSTDVGNLFFEQDLVVGICNVNEPPVVASPIFSLPENSPAATPVGTLVATDPEGGPLAFAIVAGNVGGAFAISGTGGAITVANSAALDFETTPVFTLTVTVSDGVNTVFRTVPINLQDVNEPPTISGATFTIPENSPAGTVVGTVAASDPEGALTLAITAGNVGGAFAISGTGEITVANSAALDFETTPVFTLTVTASDGTFTVPATVTVNLTDVAEAIPNPILVFDHKNTSTDAFGTLFDYYNFTVANYLAYPAAMFAASPALPPCGLNTSASRTWVDFHRASDNSYIYGFCALGQPSDLNGIWFAVPAGTAPPPNVYIIMTDRLTSTTYTSNVVAVPFP